MIISIGEHTITASTIRALGRRSCIVPFSPAVTPINVIVGVELINLGAQIMPGIDVLVDKPPRSLPSELEAPIKKFDGFWSPVLPWNYINSGTE